MSDFELPKIGEIWKPWYPAHNRIGLPIEWVPRRILVEEVHDFSLQSLSIATFMKRPMVRRGSILICGKDLDLGGPQRKLYLEATSEYDLPLLRIGCVDRLGQVLDWVGRDYEPTSYDRAAMMYEIYKWNEENEGCGLELGIFRSEAP